MQKVLLTLGLGLLTLTTHAIFTQENWRDFLNGAGSGAVHGVLNKLYQNTYPHSKKTFNLACGPYAFGSFTLTPAQAALYPIFYTAQDKYLEGRENDYGSIKETTSVAFLTGHGLAQGIIEGSKYDRATNTIRPGIAFNMTQLYAVWYSADLLNKLWKVRGFSTR